MNLHSLNICFICLILFWQSAQRTLFQGFDGQGRIFGILAAICFFSTLACQNATRLKNTKKPLWGLWCLYAAINTFLQYHQGTSNTGVFSFITVHIFTPFTVLFAISSLPKEKWEGLARLLGPTALVCILLHIWNSTISDGRLSSASFDPNELSILLYLTLVVFSVQFLMQNISKLVYIGVAIFSLALSILVASRMGFAGIAALSLGLWMLSSRNEQTVSLPKIFVVVVFIALPISLLVKTTTLGNRLSETSTQSLAFSNDYVTGTVFENFGDRGVYYVLGWEAFKDSPVFGIGLRNFKGLYYDTVMHSEIMIHLAELGLIGFFLYARNLWHLSRDILKLRRLKPNKLHNYLAIILVVILLSATVLFLYNSVSSAAIFGILLLFSKPTIEKS